jgi:hypothetical protein
MNSGRYAHRCVHHHGLPVLSILTHTGEPVRPPTIAPARGPLAWNDGLADTAPCRDALGQPEPEYLFDQQVQR